MKLILHDLTKEQCQNAGIADLSEEQYRIIDSSEIDRYCIGCFGCWLKTPGRCVIKDQFREMGETLAKADELLIISIGTFGSYSSAVKNVLDRSISYVEPFFEIRKGEMHHKERYHKNLTISAIFYGSDMTEGEKETAKNLVTANAVNLNAAVGNVCFLKDVEEIKEAGL